MNRLLKHLPEFYEDIEDFKELTDTEQVELELLDKQLLRLLDNQFIKAADAETIKRHEEILGIRADPALETLEFRRMRVINRYSTKPPFTVRYLQNRLDYLIGEGRTAVNVDPSEFLLRVTTNIKDAPVFREVDYTIQTIKPANMVYQQDTSIQSDIELKESITMRELDRHARLSTSWHVGKTAFAVAGEEVILK